MKKLIFIFLMSIFFFSAYGQYDLGKRIAEDKHFVEIMEIADDMYTKHGEAKDFAEKLKTHYEVEKHRYYLLATYPELKKELNKELLSGLIDQLTASETLNSNPEEELVDCLKKAEIVSAVIAALNPTGGALSLQAMTEDCIKKYDAATEDK